MDRATIVEKTAIEAKWWADKRIEKIKNFSMDTMSQNPFLIPLLYNLHGYETIDELTDFLIEGHLTTGHATGFGKLVDEKILPNVFGTQKLDKHYRREHTLTSPVYDEIDHIVFHDNGTRDLLSLKAGKWTIQLTMAVQLNTSFHEIIEKRENDEIEFDKIIVGVFYGKEESLTDKYRIVRGICTGASHDVKDIRQHVNILTGQKFWAWLNNGETDTQNWVLEGLINGTRKAISSHDAKTLISDYKIKFKQKLHEYQTSSGMDWNAFLNAINND